MAKPRTGKGGGGHLVAPVREPMAIEQARDDLIEAHGYLVAAARRTAEALAAQASDRWGSSVKRLRVILPDQGRPRLVPPSVKDHSFIEVVNQCATLERLLDALAWASTEASGL